MAVLTLFYSETLCESFVVAELNDHHTVPPPSMLRASAGPRYLVATTPSRLTVLVCRDVGREE
jgi:hypothetical protein